MPSLTNSELEESYKKRNILTYVALSCFVSIVAFLVFSPEHPFSLFIFIALILLFLLTIKYTPYFSNLDIARYHLTKMIEYSKNKNNKKFEHHLNKLAKHLNKIESDLALNRFNTMFIFNPTQELLDNFTKYLKQVYSCFENSDLKNLSTSLEEINLAMENKNISLLNESFVKFKEQNPDAKTDILFSYEKPSVLENFMKDIIHVIKNRQGVNYVVKFSFVVVVLLCLAYFLAPRLSFLEFNNNTTGVLLVVALGIANKI